MTVILVVLTFLMFVLVDYLLLRKKRAQPAAAEPEHAPVPALQAASVGGFLVPENLRYHAGHSWVLKERRHLFRVGMDEFAAALAGRVERIELPRPGQWIRQGQRAWVLYRNGEKAEMVSPTEGEVIEVNAELLADPSLARKDPYGNGWLLSVHVPDEESTGRNLVPASLVVSWMHEAVGRLYALQPRLAGEVAADGGRPPEDIAAALPDVSWSKLASEFFLT